jgi:hypothetical protein
MGNPLVRFCEGQESSCDMEEILWHCRESRQKLRKKPPPIVTEGSCLLENAQIFERDFFSRRWYPIFPVHDRHGFLGWIRDFNA